MSKTDDIFWRQFGIILGLLVLFGFVVAFIARSIAGDAFDKRVNSPSAVAERIAPTGAVRVGDPKEVVAAAPAPAPAADAPAASAGSSEGQSVYSGVCQACHMAGVAGAPKLDDAAAWAPRIATGEDALVASVLNGKGAMPPKGGNPALSEEQVRAAVAYMVSQTPGAGAKQESAAGQAADKAREMAGAAAAKAGEVAAEVADKAKDAAAAATDKAKEAVAAATGKAKEMTGAATAGKPGDEVYNSACVACHATGVANAPKLTDKAAWEPRAATGFDALVQSVLNGKGAMPPKGGAMALEKADIENAVRYMLEQAGVSAQ